MSDGLAIFGSADINSVVVNDFCKHLLCLTGNLMDLGVSRKINITHMSCTRAVFSNFKRMETIEILRYKDILIDVCEN